MNLPAAWIRRLVRWTSSAIRTTAVRDEVHRHPHGEVVGGERVAGPYPSSRSGSRWGSHHAKPGQVVARIARLHLLEVEEPGEAPAVGEEVVPLEVAVQEPARGVALQRQLGVDEPRANCAPASAPLSTPLPTR